MFQCRYPQNTKDTGERFVGLQFLLLVAGLALIVFSADILIDSAAKIARLYGVSSFIVGITVIAFGTSAPELAVGLVSGIAKANELTARKHYRQFSFQHRSHRWAGRLVKSPSG